LKQAQTIAGRGRNRQTGGVPRSRVAVVGKEMDPGFCKGLGDRFDGRRTLHDDTCSVPEGKSLADVTLVGCRYYQRKSRATMVGSVATIEYR
jgi:hypothetical protein